jgi:hypothetical protein
MGAELISAVLEIDKNVEPNWSESEKFINSMTDLEVLNIYSDAMQLGNEYLEEDLKDSEILSEVKDAREALINSLENCQAGWENQNRFMNKLKLRNNTILLAAGQTWGDNVPECDDIILFSESGAAKAAGFF